MKTNTLYYGDCLEVMQEWPDACVDLIYLDPPFNSKANYNILFGKGKQGKQKGDLAQSLAFEDTWYWNEAAIERVKKIKLAAANPARVAISAFHTLHPEGSGMLAYLSYMAQRLVEMLRLLKDTGGIYLHCDTAASHYLKILMDAIFGEKNFRNEIIWAYKSGGASKKRFAKKHDVIFYYAKQSSRVAFNPQTEKSYNRDLKPYNFKGVKEYQDATGWHTLVNMKDVWQIDMVGRTSKERLGYPTQKPLALLERIIKASSNKNNIVLDPFCGCGTTIEAADELKRKWIGIDISPFALEVVRRYRMGDTSIPLEGVPKSLDAARYFAKAKPFDFEKWAVTRIPGFAPNMVQRGDGGIDGRAFILNEPENDNLCITQVKGGVPHIDSLRAFYGLVNTGKAAIGIFITLEKWQTPEVRKLVAQSGTRQIGAREYPRLLMYSIDEHFQQIPPDLPPLSHPITGDPLQDVLL